jgi:hypothetical protein
VTSGKSPCSRCDDKGLGSEVPLGSVSVQHGDFESDEVMAEVILVGAATVSGRALWCEFRKEPRRNQSFDRVKGI